MGGGWSKIEKWKVLKQILRYFLRKTHDIFLVVVTLRSGYPPPPKQFVVHIFEGLFLSILLFFPSGSWGSIPSPLSDSTIKKNVCLPLSSRIRNRDILELWRGKNKQNLNQYFWFPIEKTPFFKDWKHFFTFWRTHISKAVRHTHFSFRQLFVLRRCIW